MTFASSFAAGLQLAQLSKEWETENAIKEAGKYASNAMEEEKRTRSFIPQAQTPQATDVIRDPSIYQQGDSLGLQGYQTGNKPIQTTVPTAPSGYMTPSNEVTPGFDTGGYYETPPNTSANPSTEQTLLGNYGTTAAFKGETPTKEDMLNMQKDVPVPFKGPQDQSIIDLAKVSPTPKETPPAEPKALDTLNEKVIAFDRAKDAYDYNMRVIRRLQETGNAKAALDYQTKVYNSELTLAQADHYKSTTTASIAKQVGNIAANTLEAIEEPGADVNKLYFDAMNKAREMYGYQGKIPFSLDPNENIKTLKLLQKDALTVSEKAELGIKNAAAEWKKVTDAIDTDIKQQKLGLDKLLALNTLTKTQEEIATSQFNRLNETVKSQFQAINSINPTIKKEDKDAIKVSYDANLKTLQGYADAFKARGINVPSITADGAPNISLGNKKASPAATSNVGVPTAQSNVNTQQVNNAFHEDVKKEPSVQDTAGGFPRPNSVTKTPAEQKADQVVSQKAKGEIEQNNARIKLLAERLSPKALAKTSAERQMITDKEISKIIQAKYDSDWNKTKAFWSKVAGPENEAALKEIEDLKKRNKELENK